VTDTLIVDDHLLLRVLLGDEPLELRPTGASLATTGLWYHRLCRALSDHTVVGSISRRLGQVEEVISVGLIRTVIELPDSIQLLSFRSLGWPIAELVNGGARLNLLSLEALAAARHFGAEICLAEVDINRPLIASSHEFGVSVRSVSD